MSLPISLRTGVDFFNYVESKFDVVVKIKVLGPETKMYSYGLIFQDWANNFYRFLSLPE